MEEVMMLHLSGFAGSALADAAESEALSFTVATSGSTRLAPEHPEIKAHERSASTADDCVSPLRILADFVLVGRVIAALGSAQ